MSQEQKVISGALSIHHSAYAKVSGYTEFRLRNTEVKKFTTKTKTETTSNWFDGTWNSGVLRQYMADIFFAEQLSVYSAWFYS